MKETQMTHSLEKIQQESVIKSLGISNFAQMITTKFVKNCKIIPAVNQILRVQRIFCLFLWL